MFKSQAIKDLEGKIYEKIAKEIEEGDIQKGLWTKAKSETSGGDSEIESKYIKLRFDQLREKSIANHKEKAREEAEREEEARREEKRRKKLGVGFSALVWIGSFFVVLANLDWAQSIGFESSEEANDSLMELLGYSAAHILSIPFVLRRGKKIDIQKEYVEEVKPKGIKSSFNIRLTFVLIFIGLIIWMVSPIFNDDGSDGNSDAIISDVFNGTNISSETEVVALTRQLLESRRQMDSSSFINTEKLTESNYLETESYLTIFDVRRIKKLALLAAEEQANIPNLTAELKLDFIDKVKKSNVSGDEKDYLISRFAKPEAEITTARIVAAQSYYYALFNLYEFLEQEFYNFTLPEDENGIPRISFIIPENTIKYNNYIGAVNEMGDVLNLAIENEQAALQNLLDRNNVDMTAEEFESSVQGSSY